MPVHIAPPDLECPAPREKRRFPPSTPALSRPFSAGVRLEAGGNSGGSLLAVDFGLLAATAAGFAVLDFKMMAAGVFMVLVVVVLAAWWRR